MTEIWKKTDVCEHYEVSTLGRVRNILTGEMVAQCLNDRGYAFVHMRKSGRQFMVRVHRLVALAFLPIEMGKEEVNHKDEVKTNNMVSNLEWCNHRYNCNYGTRNRRISLTLKSRM